MTRTHLTSVRLHLIAPFAALLFSACASSPDGFDTNDSGNNAADTTDSYTTGSDNSAATADTSDSDTSDSDTSDSDNNAADDSNGSDNNAADNAAANNDGSDNNAADDNNGSDTSNPDMSAGSPSESLVTAPSLGAAASFAVLGSSTVTCANSSVATGDVGVSPGISITGFDASCTLTGALHANDPVAAEAHADLLTAFDGLASTTCEQDLTGQELGGQTLPPGVYCFDTTAGVTGELTLDGGGDSDATWIFQVGSALTTATDSSVTMVGAGDPCNVFWQVGSSATIGTRSAFNGNVLATASVTLTSGSSLTGRALALNAAVTSDANQVGGCR